MLVSPAPEMSHWLDGVPGRAFSMTMALVCAEKHRVETRISKSCKKTKAKILPVEFDFELSMDRLFISAKKKLLPSRKRGVEVWQYIEAQVQPGFPRFVWKLCGSMAWRESTASSL